MPPKKQAPKQTVNPTTSQAPTSASAAAAALFRPVSFTHLTPAQNTSLNAFLSRRTNGQILKMKYSGNKTFRSYTLSFHGIADAEGGVWLSGPGSNTRWQYAFKEESFPDLVEIVEGDHVWKKDVVATAPSVAATPTRAATPRQKKETKQNVGGATTTSTTVKTVTPVGVQKEKAGKAQEKKEAEAIAPSTPPGSCPKCKNLLVLTQRPRGSFFCDCCQVSKLLVAHACSPCDYDLCRNCFKFREELPSPIWPMRHSLISDAPLNKIQQVWKYAHHLRTKGNRSIDTVDAILSIFGVVTSVFVHSIGGTMTRPRGAAAAKLVNTLSLDVVFAATLVNALRKTFSELVFQSNRSNGIMPTEQGDPLTFTPDGTPCFQQSVKESHMVHIHPAWCPHHHLHKPVQSWRKDEVQYMGAYADWAALHQWAPLLFSGKPLHWRLNGKVDTLRDILFHAARAGETRLVRFLLTLRNSSNTSPLFCANAVRCNDIDSNVYPLPFVSKPPTGLLADASGHGSLAMVKALVEDHGATVTPTVILQPLGARVRTIFPPDAHFEVFEYLRSKVPISEYATIRVKRLGFTVLMLASGAGRVELVKELLANGAVVNAMDQSHDTALIYTLLHRWSPADTNGGSRGRPLVWSSDQAVHCDHAEVIKILVANGADIDTPDPDGETAFTRMLTRSDSDVESAKLLLRMGANVNHQNKQGRTALIQVSLLEHYKFDIGCRLKLMNTLLDSGAHVDIADPDGNTALLLAAGNGRSELDIVTLLLKRGANVNHRNKRGIFAWMAARKNYHPFHQDAVVAMKCIDALAAASALSPPAEYKGFDARNAGKSTPVMFDCIGGRGPVVASPQMHIIDPSIQSTTQTSAGGGGASGRLPQPPPPTMMMVPTNGASMPGGGNQPYQQQQQQQQQQPQVKMVMMAPPTMQQQMQHNMSSMGMAVPGPDPNRFLPPSPTSSAWSGGVPTTQQQPPPPPKFCVPPGAFQNPQSHFQNHFQQPRQAKPAPQQQQATAASEEQSTENRKRKRSKSPKSD